MLVKHRDALRQVIHHAAEVKCLFPQRGLRFLLIGDVGVDADEAALGQRRAQNFKNAPIGPNAFETVGLAFVR